MRTKKKTHTHNKNKKKNKKKKKNIHTNSVQRRVTQITESLLRRFYIPSTEEYTIAKRREISVKQVIIRIIDSDKIQ